MSDLSRTLAVLADGEPVTSFAHARLTGRESVDLVPLPFVLRLWNLSEQDINLLSSAKKLSVSHGDSLLASGDLTGICRRSVPEGTVTEAVFSPGLLLWETPVSLSAEAGVSVSETVRRILAASGTGISLLAFPGEDPVRTRGQAFFGRTAECVSEALSAAGACPYLTPAGLCVIPSSGLPVSLVLSDQDLIDAPTGAGDRKVILRTTVTGWPLGKRISAAWKGEAVEGLVTERFLDADTMDGPWISELLIKT